MINTLFLGSEIPKERNHFICISAICIDSVLKVDKKNYPQIYLEQCKYKIIYFVVFVVFLFVIFIGFSCVIFIGFSCVIFIAFLFVIFFAFLFF